MRERESKTTLQRVGAGAIAAAVFVTGTTGCSFRIPNPGPKNQSKYSEETIAPEEKIELSFEKELCDCCDYSTGGYAYHKEFDSQNPRIEAGSFLLNGIFKPDSHHWNQIDNVSIFVGKEGLEAEEEGSFWRMRCNDEMPQILTGEKDHWEKVIVIKDTLDERELQQLEDGELSFMGDQLIVTTLEDLQEQIEALK